MAKRANKKMKVDITDLTLIDKLIYFKTRHQDQQLAKLLKSLSISDKKSLLQQARHRLAPAKNGVSQEAFSQHTLKITRINGLNFVLDKIGESQLSHLLKVYNQNLCVGVCEALVDRDAYRRHAQAFAQEELARLLACPSVNPAGIPKLTARTRLHPRLQVEFEHIESQKCHVENTDVLSV